MTRFYLRIIPVLVSALLLSTFFGCGGSGGGHSETKQEYLRLLNAAPHQSKLLFEFGLKTEEPQSAVVEYASSTNYFEASEGSVLMRVKRDEDVLPSISETLSIASSLSYTYVVTESKNTDGDRVIAGTLLTDGQQQPNGGQFKIRFVNTALVNSTADFFMSQPDEGLNDSSKVASAVKFKAASSYVDISPGSYRIRITETGASHQLFKSDAIPFKEGALYTVVLLEDEGGGEPYHALLIEDQF
ncbi:MAG: DUF4397 domain-containing protein [Bdellovibrionota bacterium]